MKIKIHIPIKTFAFIEAEAEEKEIPKLWAKWYNYFEPKVQTKELIKEAKEAFIPDEQSDVETLEAIIRNDLP